MGTEPSRRRRLGPREAERVVEHVGVAEHAARAFVSRTLDHEERLGIAYLALCTAALRWRPGTARGTFGAYAYGACRREILKAFRRARCRFHWYLDDRDPSLFAPDPDDDDDALPALRSEWLERQVGTMCERRRRMVAAYLRGSTPAEIGRELGESRVDALGALKGIIRTLRGRAMREAQGSPRGREP